MFIHVGDGLLTGPLLIEHLPTKVMMRIGRRLVSLDDQIFFLGRVIRESRSWILV